MLKSVNPGNAAKEIRSLRMEVERTKEQRNQLLDLLRNVTIYSISIELKLLHDIESIEDAPEEIEISKILAYSTAIIHAADEGIEAEKNA